MVNLGKRTFGKVRRQLVALAAARRTLCDILNRSQQTSPSIGQLDNEDVKDVPRYSPSCLIAPQ
jgi:hypothetical protein